MQKRVTKSEKLIRKVRRNTRQVFNAEQKILIVMEGMRGEMTVAELCRKHGISEPTYYKWNKEFIEAGKKRLSGDEAGEATSKTAVRQRPLLHIQKSGRVSQGYLLHGSDTRKNRCILKRREKLKDTTDR